MKKIVKAAFLFLITIVFFTACTNDNLVPLYEEQKAGKIVIRGYNAMQDSLQIAVDGKILAVDAKHDAFLKKIEKNHDFVFYGNSRKTVEIINKKTKAVIHSYLFTSAKPIDTLSFYTKEEIWVDDVLSFKPGTLSAVGRTGYKFIFPAMNKYSKSSYTGALDAIIRKVNGEQVGICENITTTNFSTFAEYQFSLPPIIDIELVKHGTNESYILGQRVIFRTVMQKNKSSLIVFEEKPKETGTFSHVEGLINLTDYFSF
ncbi:hypothetical protein [Flavobacterium ginsenosidimutans]|uniref:hypothetical protein n=1 Tax=Flavobacterium ginsenosidimutans TaxID=687844 RepID=UPI000DAE4339|nr:hypothetical protein [Flavobacterium ginsenosidimutans]KAF2328156.1 hypothetical protein DM444_20425 [Flavobacterium ginsenosidimutans]